MTHHLPLPDLTQDDLDRLIERIHRDPQDPDACWHQARVKDGSRITSPARFSIDGRLYLTARLTYAVATGCDPGAMTIEHLCSRGRVGCVNPEHVVLLTLADNSRAATSNGAGALNARKTHCVHGHPFDEENTRHYVDRKGRTARYCRACDRARVR